MQLFRLYHHFTAAPVKLKISNICGYTRYLQGSWKFGEDSDDEGEEGDENDEEEDLVDVIERDGHIFLRTKKVLDISFP